MAFENARRIDDVQWEAIGDESDPTARLLATFVVCGAFLHVEAIAVEARDHDAFGWLQLPVPASDFDGDDFDAIHGAVGPWQTATINGREYVILATPYC